MGHLDASGRGQHDPGVRPGLRHIRGLSGFAGRRSSWSGVLGLRVAARRAAAMLAVPASRGAVVTMLRTAGALPVRAWWASSGWVMNRRPAAAGRARTRPGPSRPTSRRPAAPRQRGPAGTDVDLRAGPVAGRRRAAAARCPAAAGTPGPLMVRPAGNRELPGRELAGQGRGPRRRRSRWWRRPRPRSWMRCITASRARRSRTRPAGTGRRTPRRRPRRSRATGRPARCASTRSRARPRR